MQKPMLWTMAPHTLTQIHCQQFSFKMVEFPTSYARKQTVSLSEDTTV